MRYKIKSNNKKSIDTIQTGCESSHLVRIWIMACTILSQSLWMKLRGPLSLEIVRVNWLSSTRHTCNNESQLHIVVFKSVKVFNNDNEAGV